MKSLILLLIMISLSSPSAARPQTDEYIAYVGTYTGKGSDGIYAFRFNAATGDIGPLTLAAKTDNPSFLAADSAGRFLYAVNELSSFKGQHTGAVSVFAVEGGSVQLQLVQQVSSLGDGPAHLSLDRSGQFLMVANYGGGNMAVFPIRTDGQLDSASAFMQAHGSSVNKDRQEAPHAHFVETTPDNRFVIVADLGIDKLLIYGFDERSGKLSADSARHRALTPGSGPRHFVFTPSGKHLYVANELGSSVTRFAYDAARGSLEMQETISTLPANFTGTNTAAEIVIDTQGKFLYVSNRGDDSIVQFSIQPEDGTLKLVDRVSCGGRSPRHITLDPTGRWMFSANQASGEITLFAVDGSSGRLTSTGKSVKVVAPVCVLL